MIEFNVDFIGTQIPYVKHFVLSKSTQYRKLKTEWRQNVFLAKSRIQVKNIECFFVSLDNLNYLLT